MKTPMQELIELITLKENKEDGYIILKPSIGTAKFQALLKKEKEVMCDFAKLYDDDLSDNIVRTREELFNATFNTKEK